MNTVIATWKNGQVMLEQPADWPDGTKLRVEPCDQELPLGIPDENWPTDPAGIARLLARMDQIQPLVMTPEEEAEWQAARKAQRELELASFNERAERLGRMWE